MSWFRGYLETEWRRDPAKYFRWFWGICAGAYCLLLAIELSIGLPGGIAGVFAGVEAWLEQINWWKSRSAENGGTVNFSSDFLVLAYLSSVFFGVVSFVGILVLIRRTKKHCILPIGLVFCGTCLYWNNFVYVGSPGRTAGLLERLLSTEFGIFVTYVVSVGIFQLTAFYAAAVFLWIREVLSAKEL